MSEQGASEAAEEKPAEDGEAQGEEVSAALTFYLFQITKAWTKFAQFKKENS